MKFSHYYSYLDPTLSSKLFTGNPQSILIFLERETEFQMHSEVYIYYALYFIIFVNNQLYVNVHIYIYIYICVCVCVCVYLFVCLCVFFLCTSRQHKIWTFIAAKFL